MLAVLPSERVMARGLRRWRKRAQDHVDAWRFILAVPRCGKTSSEAHAARAVLRRHDPHHILLEAAWADAATGLLDIARLGDFLRRIKGRIRHQPLDRVSPLSVPILLEIGQEAVAGVAREALLREAAHELLSEATKREPSCSS